MISRLIFISFLVISCVSYSHAQLELRTNPFRIFIGNPNLSIDYHVSKDVSVELLGGLDSGFSLDIGSIDNSFFKENAYQIRLLGKYYYNPYRGADKWFSSLILSHNHARGNNTFFNTSTGSGTTSSFTQNSFLLGFGIGYKWATYKGFVLEISTGFERSLFVRRRGVDSNIFKEEIPVQQLFLNLSLGYTIKRKKKV